MRKRLLSLLLVCCMAAAGLTSAALAAEVVNSGICGSNLTWVLDDEGTLTISGTGTMVDYNAASHAAGPWRAHLSQIKTLVINDGATSIGNYAFYQCTRMTSVTIPRSVTAIGSGAFFRCTSLTSVTIPDSVTAISIYMFYGCTGLTDVEIPDSVTTIGNAAFLRCTSLTSVTIPDSVTTIGNEVFYGCTKLSSVTIPDSVTEIGDDVFSLCPSLTIYGTAGSYAETYAGENGIPFQVKTDAGPAAFSDIPAGAWYADAAAWAVERGITTGTDDGTVFSPLTPCSRAEIVTFLYRAAGEPETDARFAAQFTDVAADTWYTDAVAWAVEKGITAGTGDGTIFSPMEPCSRSEIVTFLYRYEDTPSAAGTNSFADIPAGSWYADAAAWAVANGITTGTGDGTAFSPAEPCSRAEAVTFLYRDLV